MTDEVSVSEYRSIPPRYPSGTLFLKVPPILIRYWVSLSAILSVPIPLPILTTLILISDDIFFCREKNAGRITAGSLFCWPIVCRLLSSFYSSARRWRHTKASGATTYTQEGGSNNDNRQRNNIKRQTRPHTKSLLKNIAPDTFTDERIYTPGEKIKSPTIDFWLHYQTLLCVCVSS